jgi:hypothetical protein
MECIEGVSCILESAELRTLFVEVHFGILADRGLPFIPVQIENHLKKWISRCFDRCIPPEGIACLICVSKKAVR